MKISNYASPNKKGQIVIPKEIRDALGIDSRVTLNITVAGKGIYMYPVEEFITHADRENSYVKLLEKTQGKWGIEDVEFDQHKRSTIELEASKNRKRIW